MSSSTTQTTADRQRLYRLTTRILNAHSFHFITISLLFLPFTFFTSAAVQFYFSSSPGTDVATMFDPFNLFLIKTILSSFQNNLLTFKTLITIVAFGCFVILPTVVGVALITYSTNHAIHHKSITFSSTLKSLPHAYVPLLYTFIVGSIKLIIIFLVFTLSPIALTEAIKALGFPFDLSLFLIFINTILSYALAFTIVYLITIWGSAPAITILESKSGYKSLRQSANQSSEFRRHSFSIVLLTVYVFGMALWNTAVFQKLGQTPNWMWILRVGAIYMLSLLTIVHYVVANTVLYVQCRAASGEEIATRTTKGEVSGEYVKVDVNDNEGEVVDEVVKEEAKGGFSYMVYLVCIVWMIILCLQFYYMF